MDNGHSTKTFILAHKKILDLARELQATETFEISRAKVILRLCDIADELGNEVFNENV